MQFRRRAGRSNGRPTKRQSIYPRKCRGPRSASPSQSLRYLFANQIRTECRTYTACICETSNRSHFRPINQASSRYSLLGPAIKIILFEARCFLDIGPSLPALHRPRPDADHCARAASLNLDGAIGQERNMEHPTTYAGLNRRECVSRIAGIML